MSSGSPVIGVLALQGDVREHAAALTDAGARACVVRREADLAGLDGLVLPGGESTAIGRLLDVFDLRRPVSQAVTDGMPVFGSCAGMILLADDVVDGVEGQPGIGGLDVTVRRNAFGRQVESFEADLDFAGVDRPLPAVFIRAPWVDRVGAGVQVLARVAGPGGETGAGRVVAVRQGVLLATSFHPELTRDRRVHALFVAMVRGGS